MFCEIRVDLLRNLNGLKQQMQNYCRHQDAISIKRFPSFPIVFSIVFRKHDLSGHFSNQRGLDFITFENKRRLLCRTDMLADEHL